MYSDEKTKEIIETHHTLLEGLERLGWPCRLVELADYTLQLRNESTRREQVKLYKVSIDSLKPGVCTRMIVAAFNEEHAGLFDPITEKTGLENRRDKDWKEATKKVEMIGYLESGEEEPYTKIGVVCKHFNPLPIKKEF